MKLHLALPQHPTLTEVEAVLRLTLVLYCWQETDSNQEQSRPPSFASSALAPIAQAKAMSFSTLVQRNR
jgi:hypothetical protein